VNRGKRSAHTKQAIASAVRREHERTIALAKSLAHVLAKRNGNNDPGAVSLDALVTLLQVNRHRGNDGF